MLGSPTSCLQWWKTESRLNVRLSGKQTSAIAATPAKVALQNFRRRSDRFRTRRSATRRCKSLFGPSSEAVHRTEPELSAKRRPSKNEASDEYQGFQHSCRTPEAVERTLTRWQQLRCSDVTCSRCAEHVAVSAECPQRIEGGHRAESRAQLLDRAHAAYNTELGKCQPTRIRSHSCRWTPVIGRLATSAIRRRPSDSGLISGRCKRR